MQFLHVLESLVAGGIETTFLNTLRAMRVASPDDRHQILAFAGGFLEPDFRAAAHQLFVAPDPETLVAALEGGHDVVHVLFDRCAYRLLPYACACSRAALVYSKGYDLSGTLRVNRGLEWRADDALLAACDAVTFTTPSLAARFHLPEGRSKALRKAADLERFRGIPPPDDRTPPRVLCVANVHPGKRHEDLIKAFHRVRQTKEAELRLVGRASASDRARLTAQAAALGLSRSVAIVDAHSDIASELEACRVVALASSYEGVPTVLLEAMSAGRPVVATNVGHVSTIIDDGVEGFLVAPGDVRRMAERLDAVLADPTLAARLGAAGRRRSARHDVREVALELLAAMRDAAGRRGEAA